MAGATACASTLCPFARRTVADCALAALQPCIPHTMPTKIVNQPKVRLELAIISFLTFRTSSIWCTPIPELLWGTHVFPSGDHSARSIISCLAAMWLVVSRKCKSLRAEVSIDHFIITYRSSIDATERFKSEQRIRVWKGNRVPREAGSDSEHSGQKRSRRAEQSRAIAMKWHEGRPKP